MEAKVNVTRWLIDGDKNIEFIHSMASARSHMNRILVLVGDNQIDHREKLSAHVTGFSEELYSKEDWNRPSLGSKSFSRFSPSCLY